MYILLEIAHDIGHAVVEALRSVSFSLFEALLNAINTIYELFMLVATQNLFDADTVSKIYTRIGLVLGLFMIFRLTFYAIEYLINPDSMSDKQKGMGNVVKKVLIVVALLGSVHYLFREAYQFQNLLLNDENNLIAKIVLGNSSTSSAEEGSTNSGKELSWTIFRSFYLINNEGCSNNPTNCEIAKEALSKESPDGIYYDLTVRELGFTQAYEFLNVDEGEEYKWLISFDWFFGLLTSIFILWILLIYLIQVGIRCIQLAYLEIIAPIPIMMYLTPKGDDTLKKWSIQCLTTYLDVFLRLAVIYFIIIAINAIREANLISEDGGISVGIVLIIALFLFAKKVPDLIHEIFPSLGSKASLDFGIKSPKQAWNDLKNVPVLGLGAKGIGYGVNKGYKAYKTKHDEVAKIRKQARTDLKDYNEKNKLGRALHEKYGDNLPAGVFNSKEYRDSYSAVSAAKSKAKETEATLENARAEFSAAYNSSGPDRESRIAAARENLENAKKQDKAAQTRLERAKQHHEHMKKIHANDAKIEDAYKHYGDLNPTFSSSYQDNHATLSQATPSQSPQATPQMDLNTAASIMSDPNASLDDQIRAAEALDRAARERNNNNQNNQ